jgi:hypothetical protein
MSYTTGKSLDHESKNLNGVKILDCTWRFPNCVFFKKHADLSIEELRDILIINKLLMFQASSSESLMLRTARRYDSSLDAVVFSNNVPYSQEVQYAM